MPASASVESTLTVSTDEMEKLQRAAAMGALTSSIAHEFNNILTTVLNYARMGLKTEDPDAKQSFEKIYRSAQKAAKITSGVLAFSRRRGNECASVAADELLEEVLTVLEKDLQRHQIRLQRRVTDCPPIAVVPAQIEQVLMNLIINARQAMPRGGELVVGARPGPEGTIDLWVSDTGVGMAPETMERIFEPFFSTKHGPDEEGQGGAGLGLAICREIVERHGGHIRVESKLGHGSTFTVRLPAARSNGGTRHAA